MIKKTNNYPKISVITPSYNQGKYLEATIQSIIGQNYPNLEYIIMDGGSNDNSVEIIKKYESYLAHWESHKDNGQAQAINRGFSRSTGDVMAWLNSDDMYLPGALEYISKIFLEGKKENNLKIVFGNSIHLNEERFLSYGTHVRQASRTFDITLSDYIIQPSAFWTKAVFQVVGELNEELTYGFDWEWFIRGRKKGVPMQSVDKYLSIYRIHSEHKTKAGGRERIEEIANIYRKFHSERLALAYCKYKEREDTVKHWNKVLEGLRMSKFIDPDRLIHYFYFSEISLEEFKNIIFM